MASSFAWLRRRSADFFIRPTWRAQGTPASTASPVPYWACARLQPRRERLALDRLERAGYAIYFPRLREWRVSRGHRVEHRPPLFPGYCFVSIELQWRAARWSAGVLGLIMDG